MIYIQAIDVEIPEFVNNASKNWIEEVIVDISV